MTIQVKDKKNSSKLFYYKDKTEKMIAKAMGSFGEKSTLRDACEFALTSGGKRLRPLMVFLVAEALGNGLDVSDAALSSEFFHTASLIADDLPCMDNDDVRRDHPSLHKAFGETVALLASYALITAGFEWISKNGRVMKEAEAPFSYLADRACFIALEEASQSAGICGATGGQFQDLFPKDKSINTIKDTIFKKTVTLFGTAFIFGWVFGGGDLNRLEPVKQCAAHFGTAFQIADDLIDGSQDRENDRGMNLALAIGTTRARALFDQEMAEFKKGLEDLGLSSPSFDKLIEMLVQQV